MSLSVTAPVATPPPTVAPQKPAAAAAAPQPVLASAHADTVSISSAAQRQVATQDGDSGAN